MYKRFLILILHFIGFSFFSLETNAYTIDATATRVCLGDSTKLINISNVPATAKVEWDLNNDGFVYETIGNSVSYVFPTADTLSIRLKITDSSGVEYYAALIKKVIVNPIPVLSFHYEGICLGLTTQFINTSLIKDNSSIKWQWDFTTDGSTDDTNASPIHSYPTASNFNVSLKANSTFGCQSILAKSISIKQPPQANFQTAVSCENNPTLFTNTSIFILDSVQQIVWSFEDDAISFLKDSAYHSFSKADTFLVKLSLLDKNGCFDSVIKQVIVLPKVSYQDSFSNGNLIYPGNATELFVHGNFSSITWRDGGTQNPRTISDTGYYIFTLSSGLGCDVTDSVRVNFKELPAALEKANDFLTPNGDGINDLLFFQKLEAYKNCNLKVYDVLGIEVFNSADYKNNWDASRGEKTVNPGTYYYLIKCDNEKELKGNTNIIW